MRNNTICVISADVFGNSIRVKNLDEVFQHIHEEGEAVYMRKGDDYPNSFLITDIEPSESEVDLLIQACNNSYEVCQEITNHYEHHAAMSGDELQERFKDTLDGIDELYSVAFDQDGLSFVLSQDKDTVWSVVEGE